MILDQTKENIKSIHFWIYIYHLLCYSSSVHHNTLHNSLWGMSWVILSNIIFKFSQKWEENMISNGIVIVTYRTSFIMSFCISFFCFGMLWIWDLIVWNAMYFDWWLWHRLIIMKHLPLFRSPLSLALERQYLNENGLVTNFWAQFYNNIMA